MGLPLDRYAIRAALAAIAVGFTVCSSAIGRAEPVSSAEIEAALAELRGEDGGERTLSIRAGDFRCSSSFAVSAEVRGWTGGRG